ncbi:MAG: TM2 domain-containing protein [Phycisphaerae bacterium]
MYYFVIAIDGGRYGPADIDTLVQWVAEGRISAETQLIERGTERSLRADSIDAVAAALRRVGSGPAAVAVERSPSLPEAPTATRVGPAVGVPPIPPIHYAAGLRRVGPKSKLVAGLLGILLGGLGVHRFYLGYTGIGLLMLFLSVFGGVVSLGCVPGASCGIVGLWGLIEGIVCLCGGMRDANGLDLHD